MSKTFIRTHSKFTKLQYLCRELQKIKFAVILKQHYDLVLVLSAAGRIYNSATPLRLDRYSNSLKL